MATYTFGKWRAQFNLKNILDDHYNVASPIFGSTTLYPGEPRTFALSLRRDF
jgi:outer membrane receptor protein involved in Fe transport